MNLGEITPLILTYNEAANIRRALDGLTWATRVVVLDSYSTDATCQIVREYENVALYQRHFDSHARQWNHGLNETDISTEWVLSLDADYLVTGPFVEELRSMSCPEGINAFEFRFVYCLYGRQLRGSLYPPLKVLFKRTQARYQQEGHTQRLELLSGNSRRQKSFLLHDDRKTVAHWLASQSKYMDLETERLLTKPVEQLTLKERIRRNTWLMPSIMFLSCLFYKRGIFDGWAGWLYAFQRMTSEMILIQKIIESKRNPTSRLTAAVESHTP